MRLLTAFIAFTLALPVSAVDARAPKPPDKQPDYLPTRVGDTWDYVDVNSAGKEKEVRIAWTVLAVEEKNGVKTVQFGQYYPFDGKFHYEHDLEISAKGIIQTQSPVIRGVPRRKYKTPVIDLKLPHKDGQTWEDEVGKETLTAFGPEEVKVPAGTFKAIRVEHHAHVDPKDRIIRTFWYAPRVGIVKIKTTITQCEMKSFKPGKD